MTKNMKKKLTSVLMVVAMTFSCAACNVNTNSANTGSGSTLEVQSDEISSSSPGQLKILKSDFEFSAEERMSQIKAEYLIKNNGYSDGDEIVAILSLPGKSLADVYLEGKGKALSFSEYAATDDAVREQQLIKKNQKAVIDRLYNMGLITGVEYSYSALTNGIAVNTTYGNFKQIEALSGGYIARASIVETYGRPQAETSGTGADAVLNLVDVHSTGIYNSHSDELGYSGVGTSVAVLDSGFDMSHSVFNTHIPEYDNLMFKKEDISGVLGSLTAATTTPGISLDDVWYTNKIPFSYDYWGKDTDVFPVDSEHGTHVAGIIGGYNEAEGHDHIGVAIDTQLVLMKVFPDDSNIGAETHDILAALEDAATIGVDAINMSLGTACGFSRDGDDEVNRVYDRIEELGISLLVAASNSFSSAQGGAQGNTNKVTNPDSATVGAPSTFNSALSVASISGTKTGYLLSGDGDVVFFNESNSITGDQNDFFKELFTDIENKGAKYGVKDGRYDNVSVKTAADGSKSVTLEYVVVPGVGRGQNYRNIDVKGKLALVRRGDNSFEDKALQAKSAGAIGVLIYNNIEGDILMSMGKTDHIPAVSLSRENGELLAQKSNGTLTISTSNTAGPFMSDFSSWGPNPDLTLKPEITAHGGNIRSSVPGGGYDELSGTSMATPNLCGLMVLVRQYVKENFKEDYFKAEFGDDYQKVALAKLQADLANQLLMSTATIVKNEEGNPYSPRKQGAGLANLKSVVNTEGFIITDNGGDIHDSKKSKLELFDDPKRTGVYEMEFSVRNVSDVVGKGDSVSYTVSLSALTESISTSNDQFVAQKSYMLGSLFELEKLEGQGSVSGTTVTVPAGGTLKLKLTYALNPEDREYLEMNFPYGMFVEGFVQLAAEGEKVDLNVPFLAFYGDWTQAPMFDKTYFEVETEAHNGALDEDEKLKADYYATTPYGNYYYNYIVPLGTYLYDMSPLDTPIPASEDKIAISKYTGTIDGIFSVFAGLLRNAKQVKFTIVDKTTGEQIYKYVYNNEQKAFSLGGEPVPSTEFLRIMSTDMGFMNNRQYEFSMQTWLDYNLEYEEFDSDGDGILEVISGGGQDTNVRNTFSFTFTLDDEAPVVTGATFEKEYDKSLKIDRYYVNLKVRDNQYVQSVSPMIVYENAEGATFAELTDYRIPVYGGKGEESTVRIEITDYLKNLDYAYYYNNALSFLIDDYALNQAIYTVALPGTEPATVNGFKFVDESGKEFKTSASGSYGQMLVVHEGEAFDLTKFLTTNDPTVDADKDYLKYLDWESDNADVVAVQNGIVVGIDSTVVVGSDTFGDPITGRAVITVSEQLGYRGDDGLYYSRTATIVIQVVSKDSPAKTGDVITDDVAKEKMDDLRFAYFDTLYAHAATNEVPDLGLTGNRVFMTSLVGNHVSMYPGEKFKLAFEVTPWYVADNYEFTYATDATGELASITVDQNGVVEALREGPATVTLRAWDKSADRPSTLMAVLNITVKSEFVIENYQLVAYKGRGGDVVIPNDEGIRSISSFAFSLYTTDEDYGILPDDDYEANRSSIGNTTVKSVVIPEGIESIGAYAFANCTALESVTLPANGDIKYIYKYAFYGCEKLTEINLENVQAITAYAFAGCTSLEAVDLAHCYALGEGAFMGCTALKKVDVTALRNTGAGTFAGCTALSEVIFDKNGNTKLSEGMFYNTGLTEVTLYGREQVTSVIPNLAFARCMQLEKVTLPNTEISLAQSVFEGSEKLSTVVFQPKTYITKLIYNGSSYETVSAIGAVFGYTNITTFTVQSGNANYKASNDGHLLLSGDGKEILLAATGYDFGNYTLDNIYTRIADGAFNGAQITSLTITNHNLTIGSYAFLNCFSLTSVTFPAASGNLNVGDYAFYNTGITSVTNLDKVRNIGIYAFALTGLRTVTIGGGSSVGAYAFYGSPVIVMLNVGAEATLGAYAFADCRSLAIVNMPSGNVNLGEGVFGRATALDIIDLSRVEEIPAYAFYGCTSLTSVNLSSALNIGEYAFAGCSRLAEVSMPKVERIEEGAFSMDWITLMMNYNVLKPADPVRSYSEAPIFAEITLPSSLKYIGANAFAACTHLTSISIPSGAELDMYAFAFCTSLTNVNLPETLTVVPEGAFYDCRLATVNLKNVVTFGDYAFGNIGNHSELTGIDLSSAEEIGAYAFSYKGSSASALTGAVNAPKLKSVGIHAFENANITSFNAPALETIGRLAFRNTALTTFAFGKDIKLVEQGAFFGAKALAEFTYDGKTDGEINGYGVLYDGVLYNVMENGRLQLNSVPGGKNIKTLEVIEGTYRVEAYAGGSNGNITEIVFPDGLVAIGNYAFDGYNALNTVEFRTVTAPILESSAIRRDMSDPSASSDPYGVFDNMLAWTNGAWEENYTNFKGVVGSVAKMKIIIPSNVDAKGNYSTVGYDSVIYSAYFDVANLERSDYIAMESNFVNFLEYANRIKTMVGSIDNVKVLKLNDKPLVEKALLALSAMKQDYKDYGYTEEEWTELCKLVEKANAYLTDLRLELASKKAQDVQRRINELPDSYNGEEDLKEFYEQLRIDLNSLSRDDYDAVNKTHFNAFRASYEEYIANQQKPSDGGGDDKPEPEPDTDEGDNTGLIIGLSVGGGVLILVIVAAVFVILRRKHSK